jgi:hypothetical protein
MRSKSIPLPNKGDTKHVKKFAWLPVHTAGDVDVWLEFYYEVWVWREHGIWRGFYDWFHATNEHICIPDNRSEARWCLS